MIAGVQDRGDPKVGHEQHVDDELADRLSVEQQSLHPECAGVAQVAAILEGLRALGEAGTAHPLVEVVLTWGEEVGHLGAREVNFGQLRARLGFCLDALCPVGTIVNHAPGYDRLRAVFKGRGAHAGAEPELGVSAMWNLSQALDTTIRRLRSDPKAMGRAIGDLIGEFDRLGSAGYAELPLSEFPPHRRHGVEGVPRLVRDHLDQDATEPLRIAGKHHLI